MDTIIGILNQMLSEAISPTTAGLAIAVIGLNIHFGFTGLLNFGQAGFMLLGAYGFAIVIRDNGSMWLGILAGLAAALVFALILGAPTLKLRGDYLAIVTISAAEIIRFTGRLSALDDFTGGALGIRSANYRGPFTDLSPFSQNPQERFSLLPFNYTDVAGGAMWVRVAGLLVVVLLIVAAVLVARRGRPAREDESAPVTTPLSVRLQVIGLSLLAVLVLFFVLPVTLSQTGADGWWLRLVGWTLVALSTLVVLLLVRSPWGRLLRGVREDEDAMRSLGKNVFAIKMQALVIGGLFGALGGMLFVLPSTVQPDSLGRQTTFLVFTALLLGGAATIFGPVLGAVLFFSARIGIREIGDSYIPESIMSSQQSNTFSFMVVGIALMLLVIFRPQGILGDKRELRINV